MASHTPGPWHLEAEGDEVLAPEDGTYRADVLGLNGEHVVCFGHNYDEYGEILSIDDARLIAAAPDLLEAAKGAVPLMYSGNRPDLVNGRLKLQRAIDKAEGREDA